MFTFTALQRNIKYGAHFSYIKAGIALATGWATEGLEFKSW
jgi:hypothetical protein